MIRLVPEREPAPIDPETFRADAKVIWSQAGDDHLLAMQRMANLAGLLHKSGSVPYHRIRGALHEAEAARESLDKVIVALRDVIEIGERAAKGRETR